MSGPDYLVIVNSSYEKIMSISNSVISNSVLFYLCCSHLEPLKLPFGKHVSFSFESQVMLWMKILEM